MRWFLNLVFYILVTLAVLILVYNLGKMLAGDPGNTPSKTVILTLVDPVNWLLLIVWAIRRNVTGRSNTAATDIANLPRR
ncbi:MAG: hypothetical protein ACYC5J_07000 [Chloroflexota bacterium]